MNNDKKRKNRRKRKIRMKSNSKDRTIYKALINPKQTTSVIDENGIKRWLNHYDFISTLNRSIKYHKEHLSAEEADITIYNYEMPAIQRCLEVVLMMNCSRDFDDTDLNKYIARRFKHITLEMLSKDYQTEEAIKFKEDYDKFRSSTM